MLNAMRLYGKYVGVSIRGQMQYRASYLLQLVNHLVLTATEILAIWALFARFGSLRGWSLAEVALFYGLVNLVFSITETSMRGFDICERLVKAGDFDRILLRPRTTVLQLMGYEVRLTRLGRTLQAVMVLTWAITSLNLAWTIDRIGLFLAAVIGGVCLFNGIFLLQATMTFWTIETLELMSIITNGSVETAQVPMAIYQPWFRRFFTYVVPLGCVSYFPVVGVLGRPDPLGSTPLFQWLSPLAGVIFMLLALQAWRVGVRHYTSTGS
ncbi:MAG: ABC-2 family transporter protein [Phycisphaeraceae bacterium]|nr:ABC-2 family transporter protein [Phycisphaeraceae bacterium]